MSTDIESLYKNAKAVLWVEDPETRAWLDAVWLGAAPSIHVMVAGGRSNVDAVCQQAADANFRHVFGLVDQDFGRTNRGRWATLAAPERKYCLDVHETENLLLDAQALAGCRLNTGRRTVADIEQRLRAGAQARTWWVACCQFLAETSRSATESFPSDPGPLTSLADAEAYVLGSGWFSGTAAACPGLATQTAVSLGLQSAHAAAMGALSDGSWVNSFPGKQLFRELSGYVFQNGRGAGARLDLVKAVAEWQRANGVPVQATELRAAILRRV